MSAAHTISAHAYTQLCCRAQIGRVCRTVRSWSQLTGRAVPQLRPPTTCGPPVLLTVHWTLTPGLKPPSELLHPIGVDVIDVAELSELLQG